ncbi:hypothetical protein AGMMS49992_31770 [Clostridia bacterium]|nr:hypothetical protein AGMMS49992_31770 [Clostridia bacterium]
MLYVDIYACGSFNNKWIQSKELKYEVEVTHVDRKLANNPKEKEQETASYKDVLGYLSKGKTLVLGVMGINTGLIELSAPVADQIYVSAPTDVLESIGLYKGSTYYDMSELWTNDEFTSLVGIKYISKSLDIISSAIKLIDIADYWQESDDLNFQLLGLVGRQVKNSSDGRLVVRLVLALIFF